MGCGDTLRSVLKFDTSSIASTYPVQSAMLHVYVDGYGSTGQPHTLAAYGLNTPWAESTVTWKTPWTTPGGDFMMPEAGSAPISSADAGKWITVDVTSLAAQWVADPAMNNGVLLRAINGVAYAKFRFASREYWTPAYRPWLEVTYGMP